MTTPHADPYPPPGADVPGAPPPLLRDQRTAAAPATTPAPAARPAPAPQQTPTVRRGTAPAGAAPAVAALAGAVILAFAARRWLRRRRPH